VSDGAGGEVTEQTFEFAVTPQNDPPVVSGDRAAAVDIHHSVVVTTADLRATDADSTDAQLVYTVTGSVQGIVLLSGVETASFTQLDLAAGNVAFQNVGGGTSGSFTVSLTDGIADPQSITVDVTILQTGIHRGSPEDDVLSGGDTDETMYGEDGNDQLFAGNDDDLIFGANGADTANGNQGNDTAFGGNDNDLLFGGQGNDSLLGEDGDDRLVGDLGSDFMVGGDGNDIIEGFDGDDTAFGNVGNDVIVGNRGSDELHGGLGNDLIRGGQDDDRIFGDDGDDLIFGDLGSDTIFGGPGNDTFAFDPASPGFNPSPVADPDVIGDFDIGDDDWLDLSAAGSASNFVNTGQALASYAEAIALADGVLDGTVIYATVGVGPDTFLFWDSDGDGAADQAIQLTGTPQGLLQADDII
jgi:Ca2+-binding RTX toxin-like protein